MYQLVHFLGVIVFGYATYYQFWRVQAPQGPTFEAMKVFPGRWKYLTIWNLVLTLIYHVYSSLNNIVGSSQLNRKNQTSLQKIRDLFFTSWILPTGIFVSVTFWTLYAINRELVFPRAFDAFYPTWLNHAVHTGPIVFLILEVVTVPRILPKRSQALKGTVLLGSVYLAWITWVYIYTGIWAYPILQILNNFWRTIFLLSLAISLIGLFFVGEFVQKWRWGFVPMEKEKKKGFSISKKATSSKGKKL